MPEKLLLFARHGMSKHLALWQYSRLKASNENLHEVDPSKTAQRDNFVIPKDSRLQDSLCSLGICLTRQ
eukprot:m.72228 g.72228  ORF g.72228 m.72228 type:complete len:69 (+) comp35788_c0_seq5:903-1109(+)